MIGDVSLRDQRTRPDTGVERSLMMQADRRKSPSVSISIGAILGLSLMAQQAYAHDGNSDPAVVHACVQKSSNQVRIVGVAGSCTNAEVALHWSITGPQGAAPNKTRKGTGDTGTPVLLPVDEEGLRSLSCSSLRDLLLGFSDPEPVDATPPQPRALAHPGPLQ